MPFQAPCTSQPAHCFLNGITQMFVMDSPEQGSQFLIFPVSHTVSCTVLGIL